LQEQRNHADGSHYDQRYGTEECAAAGIKDDQRKSGEQQTGGDDARATRLRIGAGVGVVVRHGVPSPDLYRRWARFSN